ncbi:MAG: hypothetical protein AAGA77_19675 [Bacteroidota bacterium]
MNKPIFYISISFVVILSIIYISLSVPSYSLLLHFMRLIYFALALTVITGIFFFTKFREKMDSDNLYVLVGSSILFSFVIWFAFISFLNAQYATKNCHFSSYEVIGYKGRMTSGYGKLEKGKIKANQWVLTIVKDDNKKTFVLDRDINEGRPVTNAMQLQFCKGLLGTEYLNIEQ